LHKYSSLLVGLFMEESITVQPMDGHWPELEHELIDPRRAESTIKKIWGWEQPAEEDCEAGHESPRLHPGGSGGAGGTGKGLGGIILKLEVSGVRWAMGISWF